MCLIFQQQLSQHLSKSDPVLTERYDVKIILCIYTKMTDLPMFIFKSSKYNYIEKYLVRWIFYMLYDTNRIKQCVKLIIGLLFFLICNYTQKFK